MSVKSLEYDPELLEKAQQIEALLERQWNDPRAAEARRRKQEAERIDREEGDRRLAQAALDGLRGKRAQQFAREFWATHEKSSFTLQVFRRELAERTRGWYAAERAAKARR